MNFTGLWRKGDLCVNISGVFSQFSLNMIVRGLGKPTGISASSRGS